MSPRLRLRARLLLGVVGWLAVLAVWARRTKPTPLLDQSAEGFQTVTVKDGTPLHVQVGGRADADVTLVLVHGFLARSAEFDFQWVALGEQARLVRYDHRGHGRSGPTKAAGDVDLLASDLADVLDAVAPTGPVVLLGHSMGGFTVLALATQKPEWFGSRVAGVFLLGTAAGHFIPGHPIENAFRWLGRHRVFDPLLWLQRVAAPTTERFRPRRTALGRHLTRSFVFGSAIVDPGLVEQVFSIFEERPMTTVTALQGTLLRHDARNALPVLRTVPVTILAGTEDLLTRVEHSRCMAQDIGPSAELIEIEGAGHVVNQTHPEQVNVAIRGLLARVYSDRSKVQRSA